MIDFLEYALTLGLPVYIRYAFTTEAEILRLSTYILKIDNFEKRMSWRCYHLGKAGDNNKLRLSTLRNKKLGITQTLMHQSTGIPLITCRRDLDLVFKWYKTFFIDEKLGKMKHPPMSKSA